MTLTWSRTSLLATQLTAHWALLSALLLCRTVWSVRFVTITLILYRLDPPGPSAYEPEFVVVSVFVRKTKHRTCKRTETDKKIRHKVWSIAEQKCDRSEKISAEKITEINRNPHRRTLKRPEILRQSQPPKTTRLGNQRRAAQSWRRRNQVYLERSKRSRIITKEHIRIQNDQI